MAGNPFTYPAWDLLTMTQLDSLPYVDVQFGEAQNQPGSWSGSLPLADPRVQQGSVGAPLNWADSSRTGRTLLCVDLGGVLVWGGIVWTRQYKDSDRILRVGAAEVGSYFTQRIQAADYSATWAVPTDPMTIAKKVVQDAQGVTSGSIAGGIQFVLNPVAGSGQTVSVSYPGTQLSTVESIVSALSQMGYTFGFDYSFDVQYIAGTKTPQVTMNIWYPRQGRTADQTGIVLMHKDVIDFTYDEDSTKQASSIFESGGGGGGIQPIELTLVLPGYPLLEASITHSDVSSEAVLANIAVGDSGLLAWPVTTPTLTIPVPLPDPVTRVTNPARLTFGGFVLGDDIIHRIDPVAGGGENVCPRFPNGYRFEWRIVGWTCGVPSKGLPTILLDLGLPPSTTLPPIQPPLS